MKMAPDNCIYFVAPGYTDFGAGGEGVGRDFSIHLVISGELAPASMSAPISVLRGAELSEIRALLDFVEVIQNSRGRCFSAQFWAAHYLPCPAMMLPLESINSGQLKPKAVILPVTAGNLASE